MGMSGLVTEQYTYGEKLFTNQIKASIYLRYHLWKTSALHANLCSFMILYYYNFPHLPLLVRNWMDAQREFTECCSACRGEWGCRQAAVALTLGIMTTLCTGCTKIMWHFRACFKHFKESIVFADSSLNPTVPQHFNEIRTWHRKLLMWIR